MTSPQITSYRWLLHIKHHLSYFERLTLAHCTVLQDNQDTALQNTRAKTILGPNQQDKTLTCAWPAISIPASRNSSKSSLNFPEAAASSPLWPRVAWTTSPADWFRSAAAWFSSLWASWNDLELGGSWKRPSAVFYCLSYHTRPSWLKSSSQLQNTKCNTYKLEQSTATGLPVIQFWMQNSPAMGQLSARNLCNNLSPAVYMKWQTNTWAF